MTNMKSKVFLIGGTPGAGKTTLSTALANRLGIASLDVDDLVTAAVAITTPTTHPGIHAMRKIPHVAYFTNSSVAELKADANARHEATWPMVTAVIRKYVQRGSSIVINGWHLRPAWTHELALENICTNWIVISPTVLEARERSNFAWFEASPQPEKMFANFMGRSLWYNELIQKQARELNMNILAQDGQTSVEALCDMVLARVAG